VADEVDLAAEAIDQGDGVGGEGVEVVGTDDRRGRVAAQPWRDDAINEREVPSWTSRLAEIRVPPVPPMISQST
jgi:hypothetical protein